MRTTYKSEKLSVMSCALAFLKSLFRLAYQSRRWSVLSLNTSQHRHHTDENHNFGCDVEWQISVLSLYCHYLCQNNCRFMSLENQVMFGLAAQSVFDFHMPHSVYSSGSWVPSKIVSAIFFKSWRERCCRMDSVMWRYSEKSFAKSGDMFSSF